MWCTYAQCQCFYKFMFAGYSQEKMVASSLYPGPWTVICLRGKGRSDPYEWYASFFNRNYDSGEAATERLTFIAALGLEDEELQKQQRATSLMHT